MEEAATQAVTALQHGLSPPDVTESESQNQISNTKCQAVDFSQCDHTLQRTKDLETDGLYADIPLNGAASASNQATSKQALPPGFGFSASTRKYRTDHLKLPNNRNIGPYSLLENEESTYVKKTQNQTYVDNTNVKKTENETYFDNTNVKKTENETYVHNTYVKKTENETYDNTYVKKTENETYEDITNVKKTENETYFDNTNVKKTENETYEDITNVTKTEDDNLDSSGSPEEHYNKANNSCIIFMEFDVCIVCEHPIREFEEDGLTVKYCSEELLPRTPNEVPVDFANNMQVIKKQRGKQMFCSCISWNKTRPCVESRIYIAHEAADTRKGDYFGGDLRTYKDKFEDGVVYYRHCLVNIEHDGPAEKMKFQAGDEIVLFNDEFAPELKPSAVLALFRSVKVDGQTPLKLVVRRKTTDVPETKPYTWIEVTAILAPDKRTENQVLVEKSSFTPLRNNRFDIVRSLHLYEIPGSQLFLKIDNDTVSADVLDGAIDQSKILRRLQYWEDEKTGRIIYAAALCEESMTKYISTDKDCSVVLDTEPQWFHMSKQGADISFTLDGKYFAFDREHRKAVIQANEFKFNEYPANKREVLERLLASSGALASSNTTSQVSILTADENIGKNHNRLSRENSSIDTTSIHRFGRENSNASSSIHRVSSKNSIESISIHRVSRENSSNDSNSISSSTMSLSQRSDHSSIESNRIQLVSRENSSSDSSSTLSSTRSLSQGSDSSYGSKNRSRDLFASSFDGSSGYGGSLPFIPDTEDRKENIPISGDIVIHENICSSQTTPETSNTSLLAKGLLLDSKETSV